MPESNDTSSSLTVDEAAQSLLDRFTDDSVDTEDQSEPQEEESVEETPTEDAKESEVEGESDDTQAPAEDEVEADDEAEDESKSEPRKLKVKLEDGEYELTEDELKKGYMRTADYTRKRQADAEARKITDAELDATRAERSQYSQNLEALRKTLIEIQGAEPDWAALQKDPQALAQAWAQWNLGQKELAKIEAEQAEVARKAKADEDKVRAARLVKERELLITAIPAWKDAEVAKKQAAEIREYALGKGFTPDELKITDHRLMVLLHDAYNGDKARKALPSVREKIAAAKVKVAPPGTPSTTSRPREAQLKAAKQRVAKSGKVSDAAALLNLMVD